MVNRSTVFNQKNIAHWPTGQSCLIISKSMNWDKWPKKNGPPHRFCRLSCAVPIIWHKQTHTFYKDKFTWQTCFRNDNKKSKRRCCSFIIIRTMSSTVNKEAHYKKKCFYEARRSLRRIVRRGVLRSTCCKGRRTLDVRWCDATVAIAAELRWLN